MADQDSFRRVERAGSSRRTFLAAGGTLATAALLGNVPSAQAAEPSRQTPGRRPRRTEYSLPSLVFDDAARQRSLGQVYEAALTGLIGINTIYAEPSVYDHADLVTYPPGAFVRAGGGYPSPQRWTRDAAVNAWNAASLIGPDVGGTRSGP